MQQSSSKTVRGCRYCEKTHGKGQCPAYGKICSSCNKRDHFASVCLSSKQIKSVCVENSSDSTDYEDNQFFIGSVEVDTKQLTELNSSENNIRPEKDQLTELDSSENNSFQGKFMTVSNKDLNCMKLRPSLQVTMVVA